MTAIDINRLSNGVALPKEISAEILNLTQAASAFASVSKNIALPGSGASIPVVTGGASAAWVAETDEIGVSRPSFDTKEMTAYKLGVVVPFSREFVRDAGSLYDAAVAYLPTALALKFDQTVAGSTAPGSNFDVLGGAAAKVVDGTNTADDIFEIIKALGVAKSQASAWIASPLLHALILTAPATDGRPLFGPAMDSQSVGSLFGAPIHRVSDVLVAGAVPATDPNTIGFAGDFTKAFYGTVQGVQLSVSDQATLTDGQTTLNLWQRDMVAVKATIEVGFRVGAATNYIKIIDKAAPVTTTTTTEA